MITQLDLLLQKQREAGRELVGAAIISPLRVLELAGDLDSTDLLDERARQFWETLTERRADLDEGDPVAIVGEILANGLTDAAGWLPLDSFEPAAIRALDTIRGTKTARLVGESLALEAAAYTDERTPEQILEDITHASNGNRLKEAAALARSLKAWQASRAEVFEWAEKLRNAGIPKAEFLAIYRDESAEPAENARQASPSETVPSWPYSTRAGRLVVLSEAGGGELKAAPIGDFAAAITAESIDETGARWFSVEGKTAGGPAFSFEISAADFADDRKLKAAILEAAGARAAIFARMSGHVGPAIQKLSPGEIPTTRRFDRTGWADGGFLIPGREPEGVTLHLARWLPYEIRGGDLEAGLQALDSLIRAFDPQTTLPIIAAILQAPLARLAGWASERYGLAIIGRTGSLKTSLAQVVVTIYGPGFSDDSNLLKWGEGATRNAIMALAARAADLPFLIDNFKPNTGEGERGFVSLIHNLLEGGEKARLTRSSSLREARPVYTWPVFTGEDLPDRDPATLARLLVVPLEWPRGKTNAALAFAQAHATDLQAVGGVWLDWLESDAGRAVVKELAAYFPKQRGQWAEWITGQRPDTVNPLRIASNLASNQVAFWAALRHPTIGPALKRYENAHRPGLMAIAENLTGMTAQALEGQKFIGVLSALVVSGQAVVLPRDADAATPAESDRFIGWRDAGGLYLVPELARRAVERLAGADGLNRISDRNLYAQLAELGALQSTDRGRQTRLVRVGIQSRPTRVLHLRPDALEETEA